MKTNLIFVMRTPIKQTDYDVVLEVHMHTIYRDGKIYAELKNKIKGFMRSDFKKELFNTPPYSA